MSPRRTVDELLEVLGDVPLSLVYIAATVEEARRAEQILDERSVEYAVSLETFSKTFSLTLGAQYHGVFFYVPQVQHRVAQQWLENGGLRDTLDLE